MPKYARTQLILLSGGVSITANTENGPLVWKLLVDGTWGAIGNGQQATDGPLVVSDDRSNTGYVDGLSKKKVSLLRGGPGDDDPWPVPPPPPPPQGANFDAIAAYLISVRGTPAWP